MGGGRLVAVTGGTGFIGGHATAELLRRGWRLRLLARGTPRDPGPQRPVELVRGDLADPGALAALVAGADAVLHLAGRVKALNRREFFAANADGTAALADAWAAHAPGARFVLVSSLAARAPGLSPYAASKRAGEAALAARARPGADWSVLRPAAVYGPGDRETLALFRAALLPVQPTLNGPRARVTVIEAGDLARAVAAVLETGLPGATAAVSDARSDGYRWQELIAAAAAALDRPARPVRLPEAVLRLAAAAGRLAQRIDGRARMLTPAKAREILHEDWSIPAAALIPATLWRPQVGLAEGFARAAAWYRANRWL